MIDKTHPPVDPSPPQVPETMRLHPGTPGEGKESRLDTTSVTVVMAAHVAQGAMPLRYAKGISAYLRGEGTLAEYGVPPAVELESKRVEWITTPYIPSNPIHLAYYESKPIYTRVIWTIRVSDIKAISYEEQP